MFVGVEGKHRLVPAAGCHTSGCGRGGACGGKEPFSFGCIDPTKRNVPTGKMTSSYGSIANLNGDVGYQECMRGTVGF